jgi:hypothetical protein
MNDIIPDDLNPKFIFNTTNTELLVRVLKGEIDPMRLVKEQLVQRGVDENGFWVGFAEAKRIHNV